MVIGNKRKLFSKIISCAKQEKLLPMLLLLEIVTFINNLELDSCRHFSVVNAKASRIFHCLFQNNIEIESCRQISIYKLDWLLNYWDWNEIPLIDIRFFDVCYCLRSLNLKGRRKKNIATSIRKKAEINKTSRRKSMSIKK